MSEAVQRLYDQALTLKPKERQWLADELLNQFELEPVTEEEVAESGDDPEFLAMLEQRMADHDANPQDALPAEEALANIRAELDRRQSWRSR